MLRTSRRKQSIIIALAIIFLLGKVLGLHAHGHVDSVSHHHSHYSDKGLAHPHEIVGDHANEKIHLANLLNDSHHISGTHDGHGANLFDIENTAVIKKQSQSFDVNLVFLFLTLLIIGIVFRLLHFTGLYREFIPATFKKFYLTLQPLRAPPFFA